VRKPFLIVLFIIVSFLTIKASAQISDGLYKALPDSLKPADKSHFTENEKIKFFHSIGKELVSEYNVELSSLLSSYDKQIATSGNPQTKVSGYSAIADYYITASDYNQAFNYYQKVIQFAANNPVYNKELSEAYVNLASLYMIKHQIDSSVDRLEMALSIGDQKDSIFMCEVYNAYQIIYLRLNQNQYFLDYTNKYISMMPASRKWNSDYTIEIIYKIYAYQGLFEETNQRQYLDSANTLISQLMQTKKNEPQFWYATCYFLLGRAYFWNNDYKQAAALFDSCLLPKYIDHSLNDPYMAEDAKHFRIISMVKLGDKDALITLDTMKIWERDFSMLAIKNQVLYQAALKTGDWKKALQYYKSYVENTDSSAIIANRSKIFIANQKYSVAEKEAAINTLEKEKLLIEKRDSQNRTIALIMFLGLIIAILSLMWYYKQQQLKKEKQIAQLDNATQLQILELEEKARALREQERKKMGMDLHDTLAGTLAAVKIRTEMMLPDIPDASQQKELKNIIALMDNAYNKARNKSHEWYKPKEILQDSSFSERIKLILNDTLPGNIPYKEITIDDSSLQDISLSTKIELLQIIKESVTNILKHAKASKLDLLLYGEINEVVLKIKDDGKGFNPASPAFHRGLGLKSIYHRVEEMHGKINILSSPDKGTEMNITLPVI